MTIIKTMTATVKWNKSNIITCYYYGDKDDYNSAIWYDDNGNAYKLQYARLTRQYTFQPNPYYNK